MPTLIGLAELPTLWKGDYAFGAGGGNSNAIQSWSKFPLCAPSQNGLFFDNPHLHKEITVLPFKLNGFPWASVISKSPSTRIEPLEFTLILVDIFSIWFLRFYECKISD